MSMERSGLSWGLEFSSVRLVWRRKCPRDKGGLELELDIQALFAGSWSGFVGNVVNPADPISARCLILRLNLKVPLQSLT